MKVVAVIQARTSSSRFPGKMLASVGDMTMEEIDNILKSKNDRNLLIEVYHDHRFDRVILTLKRRI